MLQGESPRRGNSGFPVNRHFSLNHLTTVAACINMITANVVALGDKELSAELPRIQLNDIGEKSGGATGAEVTQQVTNAIIARVGPAVASLGLEKYVGKSLDKAKALLNEKVGDQLGESLGDKAKEGTEGLKKLLGK